MICRRRNAAYAVSCHVFSSRLPYAFGTRIMPAIYLCNLSPVCLRRLLARSDGRWGVSAPAKPIQPGDEAGLFGRSRWAMAEVVLSDRVFCFQAALFSVLFQEQISTDDLFHLLIFALASKTFAFSLGYPLVSGGHKWTRTIDLTLIRRAL